MIQMHFAAKTTEIVIAIIKYAEGKIKQTKIKIPYHTKPDITPTR